jgi:predicted lipoprotein with Yx(FWY)xxD motif
LSRKRATIAGVTIAAATALGAALLTSSGGASSAASGPTVQVSTVTAHTATVNGQTEDILTDGNGMPLYYFAGDKASTSRVSGRLAALWPPVTAKSTPTATGLSGELTTVHDAHGTQVAYNGHLLYTFVSDRNGVVSGQGVQNFFVATPNLAALQPGTSSTSSWSSSYGGY